MKLNDLEVLTVDEINQAYLQGRIPEEVMVSFAEQWQRNPDKLLCCEFRDGLLRVTFHQRKRAFCRNCKGE